jgi:hypothetical protein
MLRSFVYLSLPVVLGAVFSNRMAIRLSDVDPVHWATTPLLALSVWIVYTTDRLLDVRKNPRLNTNRHQFHIQNAELLWGTVGGVAAIGAILTFFLPGNVIRFGAGVGILCGLYVLGVAQLPERHPLLVLKEPLVALLFAVGIWGPVWVQRVAIGWPFKAQAAIFLGIALQNMLLFSTYEQHAPGYRPAVSLATLWGQQTCDTLLRLLTLLLVGCALAVCFFADDSGGGARFSQRSSLILAIMSLTLYAIQRYPTYFLKNSRFRFYADAVFWLPALVL